MTNEPGARPRSETGRTQEVHARAICDYEGSDYEANFWIGGGRDYEDRVERIALRRLLPPQGQTLVDVGAGFGRLADLYTGYERVILVDYSRSLLRRAQERLGHDARFIFVAADVYNLPLTGALADAVIMIRVLHHLTDPPAALSEVARLLKDDGVLILEFANKRNIKAILRFLLRRGSWNPFRQEPIEFVRLNYNFHPHWMRKQLEAAGLRMQKRLAVSHFRLGLLKRLVPPGILAGLDGAIQWTGRWWLLSPSGFLLARQAREVPKPSDSLFCCPFCRSPELIAHPDRLDCPSCGRRWPRSNSFYDFKEPLP